MYQMLSKQLQTHNYFLQFLVYIQQNISGNYLPENERCCLV